jgi:hypothetical protein
MKNAGVTPEMVGAGAGALLGGLGGYLTSKRDPEGKRKHPLLRALIGVAGGTLLGSTAGALAHSARIARGHNNTVQRLRGEIDMHENSAEIDDLTARELLDRSSDPFSRDATYRAMHYRNSADLYRANQRKANRELESVEDRWNNLGQDTLRRALTLGRSGYESAAE